MAHSYAQQAALNCPDCGQSFSPDIWLIIDVAERPDLLARVRDRTIHDVACPNGHAGALDAPLLIFRPGESRPLLFSPPQGTTVVQDRQIAAGLMNHLRSSLGGAWQDEWLDGVAVVPREALPAVLDEADPEAAMAKAVAETMLAGVRAALDKIVAAMAEGGGVLRSPEDLERVLDERPVLRVRLEAAVREAGGETAEAAGVTPADRLVAALWTFVEAPNWLASYRYLTVYPELLSDAVSTALVGLVDAMTAGELTAAAEAEQAFEEVKVVQISMGVSGNLPRYREDVRRADEAEQYYLVNSDSGSLDVAVAAWERILNDSAFTAEPQQFQLAALNAASIVFLRRYWADGRPADLDRALALSQDAVRRTPPDSIDRSSRLTILGNGLYARYEFTGRLEDLDAATGAYLAAVSRRPPGSPDRAAILNNLGLALYKRYWRTDRPEELNAAIAVYQAAVRCRPPDSPDGAGYLSNLGNGLSDRYARTGQRKDLDAAIEAYQDAVRLTPPNSPDRAPRLSNLGNGLRARYARTGQPEDLEWAIAAWEEAVQRAPVLSHNRPAILNSLGNGLRERYARTGQRKDLDAAIEAYQDAVRLTPPNSPDRAPRLSNLGNGLRARSRMDQPGDLDAAVEAYQDAVRHTLPDSPHQAAILNNLGNGLSDRYARTGQWKDLNEAIAVYEDAVRRTPLSAPDRASRLSNLGAGLRERYARTGQLADLERAIAAFEDAVQHTTADSPDRAGYQNNLGNGLRDCYARTRQPEDLNAAIEAYEDALATLDRALLDSPVAFVLGQQARWGGLYAATLDVLATAGRSAGALAAAEGSKSRLLAGLVGRGDLPAPPEIPAELVVRERALANRLNAFDATELATRGTEAGAAPRLAVADRAAIVAELREVWGEMAARGSAATDYVAIRRGYRLSATDLSRLAGALEPGTALLSLFSIEERTLLFLWSARAAAPLLFEAAIDADELHYDILANYKEEVLNRATTRNIGRPLTHRWRALGQPLLGPLLTHLDGVRRLVIAPEGVYHQLPLHTLWLSDAGDTLIDHCAVSYVPALSVLERLRRRERATTGGAAIFGYTHRDDPVERAPFLGEAVAVAERAGVAPRLDGDATGAALEAATASPLRLLHLSCHGYFNDKDALRSGVRLADGVYTARRFLARRLQVELVTLSACQTGISRSLGGDEISGLSMALLTAGARSLLLGLWSVSAVTTAVMMVDFYDRLWSQGEARTDKAEALRQTMLALRDGRLIPPGPEFDPSDPYYWAPFVLVGDWR